MAVTPHIILRICFAITVLTKVPPTQSLGAEIREGTSYWNYTEVVYPRAYTDATGSVCNVVC